MLELKGIRRLEEDTYFKRLTMSRFEPGVDWKVGKRGGVIRNYLFVKGYKRERWGKSRKHVQLSE
jgi:hypothetical protein